MMIRATISPGALLHYPGWALVILFTWLIPFPVAGQVVALQGGTSTQFQTSGAEADYQWNNWSGFLSLGYANGFRVGALARTKLLGYRLAAGDMRQSFNLDSDQFEPGMQSFSARGVEISKSYENMSWSAFAGTSALERYYTFYHVFDPDVPTGAAFINWKINPRLRFRSSTVVQDKLTSLHSLRLELRRHWSLVGAAGVGRNRHYYSAGTDLENSRFRVTASYTGLGRQFERFTGINAVFPERKGLNARLSFRPARRWIIYASHERMSSRSPDPQSALRDAGLDSIGANGSLGALQLSATATSSRSDDLWTKTASLTLSRPFLNRFLSATGVVTQVNTQYGRNRFYVGTLDERVSPRLHLRETYTQSGRQHTITAGGQFLSNRVILGVDQQLVYNTLAGGGRSVFHAWTINLKLPLIRGVRLNVNSFIDPAGRVQYTAFLDGLFFAHNDSYLPGAAPSAEHLDLGRYMVRGIVQDESGKPVWGIAVQIDSRLAFSDSTGQFYVRFGKHGTFPVYVRPEQSLSPFRYVAVRVPATVEAQDSETAAPVQIVVRRVAPGSRVPSSR